MNEKVENLILEHLRAIRGKLDDHDRAFDEVLSRLLRVESGLHGLRRDQASDADAVVGVQAQIDRLRADIERIKKRLDLVE